MVDDGIYECRELARVTKGAFLDLFKDLGEGFV
jgi:hypothetical protein